MAKLLDAGREIVAKQGSQSARIDDVVAQAGLSHGTFYLYFTDKDDLLRALAEECVSEVVDLAASLGPVDRGEAGLAELRAWVGQFVAIYRRWGAVIRVFMEQRNIDRRLMKRGAGAFGQIRSSLVERLEDNGAAERSELAAAALLAMVERYSYMVVSRPQTASDEVMVDTLARMIHRGWFGGQAELAVRET